MNKEPRGKNERTSPSERRKGYVSSYPTRDREKEHRSGQTRKKKTAQQAKSTERVREKRTSASSGKAASAPKKRKKNTASAGSQTPRTAVRKRKGHSHLIFPVIIFVLIAVYLGGQVVKMASTRSDIAVETVGFGTIESTKRFEGLVVRDEHVVKSSRTGQPFYQHAQGDWAAKNDVVCTVKNVKDSEAVEKQLDQIDKKILENQKDRGDLSVFAEDIKRLENNMSNTVDTYAGHSMKNDVSYLYNMKNQISAFMEQRSEIWLGENTEGISELSEERSQYQKKLEKSVSDVTADRSGIVCFSYDGRENELTPKNMKEIKKNQLGNRGKTKFISKTESVQKGDPLFKIIGSNEWHIVCWLPNEITEDWKKGQIKDLDVISEDESFGIEATIEELEVQTGETKVIFSSYDHMDDLMEKRVISFEMEGSSTKGLKIPRDAIVEKSLVRIPVDCVTESGDKIGVIRVSGNENKFLELPFLTIDQDYAYLEQKDAELGLGDVILKGTGKDAEKYTVESLESRTGVYVANSSVARFVVIDILKQTQEYAIVRSGAAGLQAYDTIVSDARTIVEGQKIY